MFVTDEPNGEYLEDYENYDYDFTIPPPPLPKNPPKSNHVTKNPPKSSHVTEEDFHPSTSKPSKLRVKDSTIEGKKTYINSI